MLENVSSYAEETNNSKSENDSKYAEMDASSKIEYDEESKPNKTSISKSSQVLITCQKDSTKSCSKVRKYPKLSQPYSSLIQKSLIIPPGMIGTAIIPSRKLTII